MEITFINRISVGKYVRVLRFLPGLTQVISIKICYIFEDLNNLQPNHAMKKYNSIEMLSDRQLLEVELSFFYIDDVLLTCRMIMRNEESFYSNYMAYFCSSKRPLTYCDSVL